MQKPPNLGEVPTEAGVSFGKQRGRPMNVLMAVLVLISVLAGVVTAGVVLRWPAADPASPRLAQHTAQAVQQELVKERGVRQFVASRTNPTVATGLLLTAALGLVIVGGIAFGLLVYLVRGHSILVTIDHDISAWVNDHNGRIVHDLLQVITQLGSTEVVIVAAIVLAIVEFRRVPSRWILPFLLVVLVGESVLTNAIKELLARARPTLNPAAHLLGPSFPSGHTATAAAFWAAAALLIGRARGRRAHAVLAGGAVAIAVAVGCSRVFLDVHWLSDVAGGLALGWAWFALCSIAFGGRLLRFGAPVEIAERVVDGQQEASASPVPDDAIHAPTMAGHRRSTWE